MDIKLKTRLNHIEFWVSDLRKSIKFYNSFLPLVGWKQISEVSFTDGNTVIYFQEMKDVQKTRSLGVRHLCFQATEREQVDRVYNALVNEQAKFIRGPLPMPYSKDYYTIDFFDPDGQVLEVPHTPHADIS